MQRAVQCACHATQCACYVYVLCDDDGDGDGEDDNDGDGDGDDDGDGERDPARVTLSARRRDPFRHLDRGPPLSCWPPSASSP